MSHGISKKVKLNTPPYIRACTTSQFRSRNPVAPYTTQGNSSRRSQKIYASRSTRVSTSRATTWHNK
jgi:hypothetical protein